MKFDMYVKNIKNIKINGYIFKIHIQKRDIQEVWRVYLQTNLEKNFVHKIDILKNYLQVVQTELRKQNRHLKNKGKYFFFYTSYHTL